MKKIIYILLLVPHLSIFAQGHIQGRLQNEKKEALIGVTALVMDLKDSSFVKGAISDPQGFFQTDELSFGNYVLTFSMLGFEQKSIGPLTITNSAPVKNLGIIVLEVESVFLNEVTVTSKPPFLEQKIDRLVVNLESSIVSSGSTALEVLQKVPGILVINDEIKMNGRNGVIIYIDGRPSNYTDMTLFLKEMPSNNIAKIEVITNPGAKYDAAGSNGIINIVLKKNANQGTNGNLSLGIGYGKYEKGNLGLSPYYWTFLKKARKTGYLSLTKNPKIHVFLALPQIYKTV